MFCCCKHLLKFKAIGWYSIYILNQTTQNVSHARESLLVSLLLATQRYLKEKHLKNTQQVRCLSALTGAHPFISKQQGAVKDNFK